MKKSTGAPVDDAPSILAILGDTPTFPDSLHVGKPNIGDRNRLLE